MASENCETCRHRCIIRDTDGRVLMGCLTSDEWERHEVEIVERPERPCENWEEAWD